MLALTQCNLQFGKTLVVDEKNKRDDGLTCLLGLALQFAKLFARQQQFAVAVRSKLRCEAVWATMAFASAAAFVIVPSANREIGASAVRTTDHRRNFHMDEIIA